MKIGIITGKSGNTLVRYLKEQGHTIYVITGDLEKGGVNLAEEYYYHYFDINDDNSLVYTDICDWFQSKSVEGFILGTGVWFAHDIALMLNNSYGIPCSHSVDYISVFKDKIKTKELFKKYGLKTPVFQYSYDKNIEVKLSVPFVVKSSIDLFPVWLCHNLVHFNVFKDSISDSVWGRGVLIEQYIKGNDLTVPVFSALGEEKESCLVYWSKQKNYRLEGFGELTSDRVPKEVEGSILSECNLMIADLGYFGVCRFDVRVSNNEYFYLEINSVVSIRSEGSSFKAMKAVGINYVENSIDVYLKNINRQK